MLPGSVADVARGRFDVSHPVDPDPIFDDKRAYLEAYQARKAPGHRRRAGRAGRDHGSTSCRRSRTWWDPLLEQADMICAGIDQPVPRSTSATSRLVIDFATREVRRPLEDEDPRYQFFIERELVDHLVREHVEDWVNELFLSMRFRARRRGPYNDYVYTWFKCLNVGAAAVRRGLLRRARADPGHVRVRRLRRPAPLSRT